MVAAASDLPYGDPSSIIDQQLRIVLRSKAGWNPQHCAATPNDLANDRAGCVGSQPPASLACQRRVDDGEYDVTRLIHGETGKEGIEVDVRRITTVDHLVSRTGLSTDAKARNLGTPAGSV